MNREDIIRMAREAATEDGSVNRDDGKDVVLYAAKTTLFLERFAALVEKHAIAASMTAIKLAMQAERENGAAEERSACVKVCEKLRPSNRDYDERYYDACADCAEVIRGRGIYEHG